MISPSQCRAARGLLNWTQADLAKAASVGVVTVRQFEAEGAAPRAATLTVLTQAFEAAGLEFIPENGGGAGIRFRERKGAKVDEGLRPDQLTSENDGGAEG
ncbi:helix-turn-helix domain-containing protein [Methylobacterium sp. E-041]|nr:helix-turn-helix domain-containing protein [Methylobacterium sp. E-041]